MIDPRELRIGNLIFPYDKSEILLAKQITGDGELKGVLASRIEGDTNFKWSLPDELIFPIPLNEEWLLRFGFEKFGGIESRVSFLKGDFQWSELQGGTLKIANYLCACKYVHQLQNLYFALTGQELTIKETV